MIYVVLINLKFKTNIIISITLNKIFFRREIFNLIFLYFSIVFEYKIYLFTLLEENKLF